MILNLHKQHGIGKQGATKTTPMISSPGFTTIDTNFRLSTKFNRQIHDDWKGAGPVVSQMSIEKLFAPKEEKEIP